MSSGADGHRTALQTAQEQMHIAQLQQQGPQAVPSDPYGPAAFSPTLMPPPPPQMPQLLPGHVQMGSQPQYQPAQPSAQSGNGSHQQQQQAQ
jgi:hypothetical protein